MSSPSAFFVPPDETEPASGVVKTVTESARRPGRFVVGLADGRLFTVGIGPLSEVGATRAGVELAAQAVAFLQRESIITDFGDRAVNALARGRKTRRELLIRLRRGGGDPALIDIALDRLTVSGVLSDDAVAHAEASVRLRRGEAPARVRQVLQRKGVQGATATRAVAVAVAEDGFDELEACRQLAEKRARALRSLEPSIARRRLMAFLQRRGFGSTVIGQVFRDFSWQEPADEPD